MKTPTDFLRALAARVGLLKDHNRLIHSEARLFLALGNEMRNPESIKRLMQNASKDEIPNLRKILGLSAIFLAALTSHTGEASPTDPHPRAIMAVSATARARGTGGQAGAVIASLPRIATAGQFRHGASERNAQRVIGSRVQRSMPSISGPRVRVPDVRGKTKGAFSVVECCARPTGGTKTPRAHYTQASWYGEECEGYPMADGRPFNPSALTCASWFHPLGSRLRVSAGGRFVVVTVTDRGPAMDLVRDGRGIDLSREAFRRLATLESGLVMVKLEEL